MKNEHRENKQNTSCCAQDACDTGVFAEEFAHTSPRRCSVRWRLTGVVFEQSMDEADEIGILGVQQFGDVCDANELVLVSEVLHLLQVHRLGLLRRGEMLLEEAAVHEGLERAGSQDGLHHVEQLRIVHAVEHGLPCRKLDQQTTE